jgi:hypothetical protein
MEIANQAKKNEANPGKQRHESRPIERKSKVINPGKWNESRQIERIPAQSS